MYSPRRSRGMRRLLLPRTGYYLYYTYTIETSPTSFLVTASRPDIPAGVIQGSAAIHYPTFTIDQTMQIRQGD